MKERYYIDKVRCRSNMIHLFTHLLYTWLFWRVPWNFTLKITGYRLLKKPVILRFCQVAANYTYYISTFLVTFKNWDGVKDEKLWYFWSSQKNPMLKGSSGNINIGGNCLKRVAGTVCRCNGVNGGRGEGVLARKRWVVFLRELDTPLHTVFS